MRMEDIKVGDTVKINDGSWVIRVDKFEPSSHIGLCRDDFTVIHKRSNDFLFSDRNTTVHNIFIKNTVTNKIYLHSAAMVSIVETPPKEMTLTEIIKELGYEVKIVK